VSVGGHEQGINAVVSSSATEVAYCESEYFIASKWTMFLLFSSFISMVMVIHNMTNLTDHADADER